MRNMEIKFVSYTGEYPCLCFGVLTLLIDGRETTFGDPDPWHGIAYDHRPFWGSGGIVYLNDNGDGEYYVTEGDWKVHDERLPVPLKPYSKELAGIMNKNVPRGHCGGCL